MKKKYAEILLRYRWLFVKGNVFICEWGTFGAEVFLCYSQFFVKGDFVIGRVECMSIPGNIIGYTFCFTLTTPHGGCDNIDVSYTVR